MPEPIHEKLQSGATGARLLDGEIVLRVLKTSMDGRALETHFAVTDRDKERPPYSLSVWAERLTTPEQARAFFEDKADVYKAYCRLNVDEIRSLKVPELPAPVLDVVWDTLYDEETLLPDTRPGSAGHCGITGLIKPPGMEKSVCKKLRTRLADMANENLHVYP